MTMGKARTAHRVHQQQIRLAATRAVQRRHRLTAYGIPAVVVLVVAIVAVFASLGGEHGIAAAKVTVDGPALSTPLATGATVPDFRAPGLDGGSVSWGDYRGEPTVLEVWAPWCSHCQAEAPVLGRIAHDFPAVKVVTVTTAVGLHPGPTPEEFMRQYGLAFPVGVDDDQGTIAMGLGVRGFPLVYYVGSDGKVASVQEGEAAEPQMRAAFSQIAGG
jgi:thiol-disulfide isomerase/thioredoxin